MKSYADRVLNFDYLIDNPQYTQSEKVTYTHMKKTAHRTCISEVKKVQLTSLNDKNYIFHDGILTLPHGHILLREIYDKMKGKDSDTIQSTAFIRNLRQLEDSIIYRHERLKYLHLFYTQNRHLYSNDTDK